ncbi:hypothetical protein [Dactylosporangium sp. CA-233914]|uniref:hypothetical protein n=1 Tax=Dactylosporangium sp. CA-233914 TaxID=3239934 RepID=UPI003D8D9298
MMEEYMVKVRRVLATLLIAAGLLLVPEAAHAAGGVCGMGLTGNYITVSFTFNPSCGTGFGNNAANVVSSDGYPMYTNFEACEWGLHPANWVFVGPTTYTEACGFGMYNLGPQSRIVKVRPNP